MSKVYKPPRAVVITKNNGSHVSIVYEDGKVFEWKWIRDYAPVVDEIDHILHADGIIFSRSYEAQVLKMVAGYDLRDYLHVKDYYMTMTGTGQRLNRFQMARSHGIPHDSLDNMNPSATAELQWAIIRALERV